LIAFKESTMAKLARDNLPTLKKTATYYLLHVSGLDRAQFRFHRLVALQHGGRRLAVA
jgi:hypothetical protein